MATKIKMSLPAAIKGGDKGADTVQPTCTYLEEASSYFI